MTGQKASKADLAKSLVNANRIIVENQNKMLEWRELARVVDQKTTEKRKLAASLHEVDKSRLQSLKNTSKRHKKTITELRSELIGMERMARLFAEYAGANS